MGSGKRDGSSIKQVMGREARGPCSRALWKGSQDTKDVKIWVECQGYWIVMSNHRREGKEDV